MKINRKSLIARSRRGSSMSRDKEILSTRRITETTVSINREEVEVRGLVEINEAIRTTMAIMDLQAGITITNIKGIIQEMTWEVISETTKGTIKEMALTTIMVVTMVEVSEFTTGPTEAEEEWAIKANHTEVISGKVETATSETYLFDINKSDQNWMYLKLNFMSLI
jgi:hypothetical protein